MTDIDLTDRTVIVGGGIIGLTIAWRLARRDHPVTVLEKTEPGAGAAGTAGGMLGLTAEVHFGERDLLALQKESHSMYPGYIQEVSEDSGIDPGYRTKGTLVVARDNDDLASLKRVFDYQQRVGLDARWLDKEEIDRMTSGLRSIDRAVYCPDDHVVDTESLTHALVEACRNRGVDIRTGVEVRGVSRDSERVRGVKLADGSRILAQKTVICAGGWSRKIEGIPEIDNSVLRPVRGQMILLRCSDTRRGDLVIRSPGIYMVPCWNGRMQIGSTMEEKGFAWEVTAGAVRTLLREAWWVMPGIDDLEIDRLSSNIRPVSKDGHPLLGSSRLDGLHIATGHGRHGILLAPITGELMARHLDGVDEEGGVDDTFDPRRFVA